MPSSEQLAEFDAALAALLDDEQTPDELEKQRIRREFLEANEAALAGLQSLARGG